MDGVTCSRRSRGDYSPRSRGCRGERAGTARLRLIGVINALLARPFSFQSHPLPFAAPALAGKRQSGVRLFSLRCKTAFLPFPGARGHGRSQGTGGGGWVWVCVGISAFPAHSHSLLFHLHGVVRAISGCPLLDLLCCYYCSL